MERHGLRGCQPDCGQGEAAVGGCWGSDVGLDGRSGEGREEAQALQSGQESQGMWVGPGQTQEQPPTVPDHLGGYVEEAQPQPLAAAGSEALRQRQHPDPTGGVVGQGCRMPQSGTQ